MFKVNPFAAVVALVWSLALADQVNAQNQSYYYLERSPIFYSLGNHTVFEAQIAPQLVVAQTMPMLFQTYTETPTKWRRGWSLSASPMVRLRLSDGRSMPVLPPSFMPHFVYQNSWLHNRSPSDADEMTRALATLEMITLQARLSHHSNGQTGCLFTTQRLTPIPGESEQECVFQPGGEPDADEINFDDGSFSTNFFRVGAFYRRLTPDEQANHIQSSWYLGAEAEFHEGPVLDQLPGAISDEQSTLYGTFRWHARAGFARALRANADPDDADGIGLFVDGRLKGAPGVGPNVPRWAMELEGFVMFEKMGGWGIYMRLFHGQDPYNVAFVNKVTRVHLGLAWIQDRFAALSLLPL